MTAEALEYPLAQARDQLGDVVSRTAYTHEPAYLTRRGRRVAVVLDVETYERLVELAENALDVAEADAARDEMADGEPAIPWEQVKADLGL